MTITNQNLDCTSDLEAAYYSKQLGPIRCYKCGMDVSKDKEISEEFDQKKKNSELCIHHVKIVVTSSVVDQRRKSKQNAAFLLSRNHLRNALEISDSSG